MANLRYPVLAGAACLTLAMLAACAQEGQDEMRWARAALERNDRIEVVAADPQSRTFTVRLKDTGALATVRLDELIASPATAPPPASAPSAPLPVAGTVAAGGATAVPGEAAVPAPPPAAPPPPAAEPPPAPPPASAALPGERLLESGPGYSIKAAGSAPAGPAGARETSVTGAALERRHEPIVCQGARLLHIDNRNLEFDGDAVSAQDGCEIHITNSHISAKGVGVAARAASVHIDNSQIEGEAAAIDASDGAQVYASGSRFHGLSRHLDKAAVHDLGGNIWN